MGGATAGSSLGQPDQDAAIRHASPVGGLSPDVLDVEISIVNHDNCEISRACLASLPAACRGLKWHATIVDNASLDGSADVLKAGFPDVTVVCNDRRYGFGANQNQVIGPVVESECARYILVLNNDTELAPGSVATLVEYADRNPTAGAVGPATFNPDGTRQPSSFRFPAFGRAALSEIYPRTAALGCHAADTGRLWLGGACLLLRVDALRQVGFFDTRFFLFFEDIDLARRLWDGGWTSELCPEASIMHHNHKTVERDDLHFAMACQLRRSCYLYISKFYGHIPAVCLAKLGRAGLLVRARMQETLGRLRLDQSPVGEPALLRGLSRYDPRKPLPHELAQ